MKFVKKKQMRTKTTSYSLDVSLSFVGVLPVKNAKPVETGVEQTAVSDTSPLNTTTCDETWRQQENAKGKEPQRMSELEASEQKDVDAQDCKEVELTREGIGGEKSHDSGPHLASERKQPVLETRIEEEGMVGQVALHQKENWQQLPECKESESAGQVADAGSEESEAVSRDQPVGDTEESLKTDTSQQQRQRDAAENRMAVQPQSTDEQHAVSRL